MKITYLGTAAAEGFPAIFCNCEYCQQARALGGKNVRTRSQALVNDDLLIDFPPDSYMHFLQNGIEADKIPYLILTHAHPDHLYREDFLCRMPPFGHNPRATSLTVLCSAYTAAQLHDLPQSVTVRTIAPYQTVSLGDYRITALPARHMFGCEALFYIIEGEKTLLYANDTGYFYEEVFSFIEEKKFRFDFVSFDCTYVTNPCPEEASHMGFDQIERVIKRLSDMGAITDKTVKYVNHFSHNGNPLHERTEAIAARLGYHASYDGCQVEF